MKLKDPGECVGQTMSRPARGAWIETRPGRRLTMGWRCRVPRGARGLKHYFGGGVPVVSTGRVPRGARGLKRPMNHVVVAKPSRVPRGARGLKRVSGGGQHGPTPSRPARGAWIETAIAARADPSVICRVPRGARGLKLLWRRERRRAFCRVPRGARGLKHAGRGHGGGTRRVASRAGRVD